MQQTPTLIRYFRIARVIVHTLLGLAIAAAVLPLVSAYRRGRIIRWWCQSLLKCFSIQVRVFGVRPDSTTHSTMFVANHISWTDIHALNSLIPVRFIAKLEIRTWPVFGYLVTKSGTLFINRTIRRDAARIVEITSESLRNLENVCFFPEGTTTDGTHMLPFKSSIVQAAVDAQATLWPIAIYYPQPNGQPSLTMAYAGETSMIESMDQILRLKNPVVELHFLTPIPCVGHTRQHVTQLAYQMISAAFNQRLSHQQP
ncbi:1-acyl-sn-glycerol-3-phosphate acyltransferase [Methylophilaceae bacterium 11]|uniref:lysophospholipid acyltransferase family protein n=1 Tax=Methylotenera sp. N17 TaxID=1502761 RepID=UPI00044C0734|nr:lysophospholipid acyltransferase family protein [Methylotenera sp. N17]EUJ09750.1 1-acyl-sn-glycerol-3-phosphate acyltransferase [Methylophilaceae bacterium 11]